MSDFRKAKLLRDEAIQDAVEMVLAANHAHLDGPYTRVEVSVYNGDDSRACNRLVYYEVAVTDVPAGGAQ
jgi:hypothetical protein